MIDNLSLSHFLKEIVILSTEFIVIIVVTLKLMAQLFPVLLRFLFSV